MIAIIDYGMGNLKNIYKALKYVSAECAITSNPADVLNADAIVLPGVGAFRDAAACIHGTDMERVIRTSISEKKPFLGICLGMQLLFESSYENGEHRGLSIVEGHVDLIRGEVKVPHMGWNRLDIRNIDDPLLEGIENPEVYFVHSYCCMPTRNEVISSTADYGIPITSSVWMDNVHALQFHPEKSGKYGLKILDNFRRLVK